MSLKVYDLRIGNILNRFFEIILLCCVWVRYETVSVLDSFMFVMYSVLIIV